MEIFDIVQGHVNELLNVNDKISKNRLLICYRCPLYTGKMGGMCNSKLWLNPNTGDVSTKLKPGYLKGCGCRLSAKTRVADARCPVRKW